MAATGVDDQLNGSLEFFVLLEHDFRLLEGDGFVGISMDEQQRGGLRGDIFDGGDFAELFFEVVDFAEDAFEESGAGEFDEGIAFVDIPIDEIGGREPGDDGLGSAADAFDGVFGVGVSIIALKGGHEGEVSAGGAAGDSDAIGVDAVGFGVVSDEANGADDIGRHFGNEVARAAAVSDDEGGEASADDPLDPVIILPAIFLFFEDIGLAGAPAAAGDEDDPDPIGIGLGLDDIEGEGHSIFVSVDNIFDCGVRNSSPGIGLVLGWQRASGSGDRQEQEGKVNELARESHDDSNLEEGTI